MEIDSSVIYFTHNFPSHHSYQQSQTSPLQQIHSLSIPFRKVQASKREQPKRTKQHLMRQDKNIHIETSQANRIRSPNSQQKSQRHTWSHSSESHKPTKLTAITYTQRPGADRFRPHACCFCLCEPMWARYSWFDGRYFLVLHSCWLLQYVLPLFPGVPRALKGMIR